MELHFVMTAPQHREVFALVVEALARTDIDVKHLPRLHNNRTGVLWRAAKALLNFDVQNDMMAEINARLGREARCADTNLQRLVQERRDAYARTARR